MEETKKIWMDGRFVDWKDAKIHVLTHTLHYGMGVFEGIRCYETEQGSAVFRLREHVDRLFDSAQIGYIKIPYSREEICKAILETIKENNMNSCYIRPLVYLGYGSMGVNPLKSPVNIAIAVWPWGAYLGEEGLAKGIRVKTSSFTRQHVNINMTKAKICGNYANSILGKVEAVLDGYDEALFLDPQGNVAEGSGENFFIVRKGVLKTPPVISILPGITRDSVIEIAKWLGIEVHETILSRDEIYIADEAFFTGTAAEVTPIREADRRQIGEGKPGSVTKQIMGKFFNIVKGKEKTFAEWLTKVK